MNEPRNPFRTLWNISLSIFGMCLLLWLAVQLISSIWLWLAIGAVVAIAAVICAAIVRERRDRW